jgi:hypothetical protein
MAERINHRLGSGKPIVLQHRSQSNYDGFSLEIAITNGVVELYSMVRALPLLKRKAVVEKLVGLLTSAEARVDRVRISASKLLDTGSPAVRQRTLVYHSSRHHQGSHVINGSTCRNAFPRALDHCHTKVRSAASMDWVNAV